MYQIHQGKENLQELQKLLIRDFKLAKWEISKQYILNQILNISLHLEDY